MLCLEPLLPLVQTLSQQGTDGSSGGIVTSFQKFRDFKMKNGIPNCISYVSTTITLQ